MDGLHCWWRVIVDICQSSKSFFRIKQELMSLMRYEVSAKVASILHSVFHQNWQEVFLIPPFFIQSLPTLTTLPSSCNFIKGLFHFCYSSFCNNSNNRAEMNSRFYMFTLYYFGLQILLLLRLSTGPRFQICFRYNKTVWVFTLGSVPKLAELFS